MTEKCKWLRLYSLYFRTPCGDIEFETLPDENLLKYCPICGKQIERDPLENDRNGDPKNA